jgi:hypothetical protein
MDFGEDTATPVIEDYGAQTPFQFMVQAANNVGQLVCGVGEFLSPRLARS